MKWIRNNVTTERGNYRCLLAKFDTSDYWFCYDANAWTGRQIMAFRKAASLLGASTIEIKYQYDENDKLSEPEENIITIVHYESEEGLGITKFRKELDVLLETFQIAHLCGKGNLDNKLAGITGYAQFEYANTELTDMFALADMAISRAGANSICELLALHKPNILIPLSAAASRGDQVLNAKSFKKQVVQSLSFRKVPDFRIRQWQ